MIPLFNDSSGRRTVVSNIKSVPIQVINTIFNALTTNNPLIFWIRSADFTRQLYVSQSFESIFCTKISELYEYPESFSDYVLSDDLPEFKTAIDTRLRRIIEPQEGDVQFRILNKMGDIRSMRSQNFPIFTRHGDIAAIAGIGIDYTQSLATEAAYIASQQSFNDRFNIFYQEISQALDENLDLHTKITCQPQSSRKVCADTIYTLNDLEIIFSKREAECINLTMIGQSAKVIAANYSLSQRTVEEYLNNARKKTRCRTKLELTNKLQQIL